MTRARAIRLIVLAAALAAVALFLFRPGGPSIEPGTTLHVEISGEYLDSEAPSAIMRLLGERRRSFAGLLSTLALARRDARIDAVVIELRGSNLGWAKAQELRHSIGLLREAGKRTVAMLEIASFSAARDYYVASACDRVVAPPGALVPLTGLAAEYLFLGGLWEKLGIEIDAERIGRYKTAVDSYTGTGMSDAHREMADALLDSIHAQFLAGVAEGRSLDVPAVRAAIDRAPVTPDELVSLGLIDAVAHESALPELDGPVLEAADYAVDPADVGFEPEAHFALVYGSGPVVQGRAGQRPGSGPVFAADTVADALRAATEDESVRAIVLRIDSPGGSSLASELVWKALDDARARGIPVIASLSDVAASGGYYAAVGTDHIVAEGATLTGSIGVFVLRPSLGGLLDKLGIQVATLERGEHADLLLGSQPVSEASRERLRAMIADTYELFVERVAAGRELSPERVDELGQGRVWTGEQALARGLVDELGGIHTAVSAGRRLLGLRPDADVALVAFPAPRTLADQFADLLQGRVALAAPGSDWLARAASPLMRQLLAVVAALPSDAPLLVPPVLVEIR